MSTFSDEVMFFELFDDAGGDSSGTGDSSGDGTGFDEAAIPEAVKQKLIDQGVNSGFKRGKEAGEKTGESKVSDLLRQHSLSESDLEKAGDLIKNAPVFAKLVEKMGVSDPVAALAKLEESDRKNMSDLEKTQADLVKEQSRSDNIQAELEALKANKDEKLILATDREKSLITTIGSLMIDSTIRSSAAPLSVDTDDVVSRVKSKVKLEEEEGRFNVFVTDEQGNKRFDSEAKPFSISNLVNEFLDARPHLKKSDLNSGAGGQGGGDSVSNKGKKVIGDFTKEQLKDPDFFQNNMSDILKAVKGGRVKV